MPQLASWPANQAFGSRRSHPDTRYQDECPTQFWIEAEKRDRRGEPWSGSLRYQVIAAAGLTIA